VKKGTHKQKGHIYDRDLDLPSSLHFSLFPGQTGRGVGGERQGDPNGSGGHAHCEGPAPDESQAGGERRVSHVGGRADGWVCQKHAARHYPCREMAACAFYFIREQLASLCPMPVFGQFSLSSFLVCAFRTSFILTGGVWAVIPSCHQSVAAWMRFVGWCGRSACAGGTKRVN
jgi:hypothetical protein